MKPDYEQHSVSAHYAFDQDKFLSETQSVFSTQPATVPVMSGEVMPPISASVGSAYEGADRLSLEMARWEAGLMSADMEINPVKMTLDARSRDMVRNDPLIASSIDLYRNGVVGNKFILNSKPNGRILGWDDETVEAVQEEIEALFEIYAHTDQNYVDLTRKMNLTDMARLGTGSTIYSGEFFGAFHWRPERKFATTLQIIDTDRLSNPDYAMDNDKIRGGVEFNRYGEVVAYHVQTTHPSEQFMGTSGPTRWERIPARNSFGRPMALHIFEPLRINQSRGVAKMVSALRQMKMTAKFQDIALQNAVIKATIAATIESDRGPGDVYTQLGMDEQTDVKAVGAMMQAYGQSYASQTMMYGKTGNVARLNGSIIPHLFPGTKLNVQQLGEGTLGTDFEDSLIRKIAAGLGISSQELAKNMSDTSFAGAKAALGQSFIQYQSVKRSTPDKIGNAIFRNWLEEVVNRGLITSLPAAAKRAGWLYEGFNLDALSHCTWIGAARGTIDELNDAKATKIWADLGVITMEGICAKRGEDWREVRNQQIREANYKGGPVQILPPEQPTAESRVADLEDDADDAKQDT